MPTSNPAAELYVPSNGTEGAVFIERWCGGCARDRVMNGSVTQERARDEDYCAILSASFWGSVPEWVYGADGAPQCTAFVPAGEKVPHIDLLTLDLFA